MEKMPNPAVDRLFEAVLTLGSVEECYAFFEDLCTIRELSEISQRFEVAELLDKGGKSYAEIRNETGASTATITRINRCLNFGNDGYRLAIERLRKKDEA